MRKRILYSVVAVVVVGAILGLTVIQGQLRSQLVVQEEAGELEGVIQSFVDAHGVLPTRLDNPESFYVAFWQSGDLQGVSHYYKMEDGTGIWVIVAQWPVQQVAPDERTP